MKLYKYGTWVFVTEITVPFRSGYMGVYVTN